MTDRSKPSNKELLRVEGLKTYFHLDEGVLKAVDEVSFEVRQGEVVGLVGESGCGKSVTARSILQLNPHPARSTGRIRLTRNGGDATDILSLKKRSPVLRQIRGGDISYIFQEPMTSLSPVHTIGNQMIETILLHAPDMSRNQARQRAIEYLNKVGIPDADTRIDSYTFQFSGGMRQRALNATALANNPSLVNADEPTTALDVTIQAQILTLMKNLQQELGLSVLYITHSLPVITEIADRVMVMYLGRIVEYGTVREVFEKPMHPYTRGLLRAIPRLTGDRSEDLYTIKGNVPVPLEMEPQCGFCSRCSQKIKGLCDCRVPALTERAENHGVRCFLYEDE